MIYLKNKKPVLFSAYLFVVIGTICATIAYSHDSSVLPNEFNVGAHEVVMSETFVSPSNWKPGDETEKTLTVRNNSESDIKVRVKYDEEWRNAAGTKTLPSIKDGVTLVQVVLQNENDWEPKADGYYYYKAALAPGATTSSLFQKVAFNRDANLGVDNVCAATDTGSVCEKPADDYEGAKYHLKIRVETIQPEFEEEWLSFSVLNKGSIVKNALRDLANVQTMTSLTFVDELPSDVLPDVEQFRKLLSLEGLPVYAYLSTRDFSSIYIYSEANKIYLNEDSSWLFSELGTISSLVLPNKLDASLVTDASYLFANNFFLKTLVLPEQFDMSRTRNMERMFSSLGALESLTSLTLPSTFIINSATSTYGLFEDIPASAALNSSADPSVKALWPGQFRD